MNKLKSELASRHSSYRRILFKIAQVTGITSLIFLAYLWAISQTKLVGLQHGDGETYYNCYLERGSLVLGEEKSYSVKGWSSIWIESGQLPPSIGKFSLNDPHPATKYHIPLVWFATLLLPIVVGLFTGFRFRLWHYLAFSALLLLELMYYLLVW